LNPRLLRAVAVGAVVAFGAGLAVALHRTGHTQGDDFALYLRQARSLVDGDIGAVIADNRFAVLNSTTGFSPIAYPWGWPMLLAPFVEFWGLDYDRLKLVVVAAFCVWLILLYGIVQRRLGQVVALAFTAVFATAPFYLDHTDELLAEYPHLVAISLFIWWYDRIRRDHSLLTASTTQLVVLGLFVTAAFNIRRESIVLVAAMVGMQAFDVWHAAAPGHRLRGSLGVTRRDWQALVTPYASFVASMTMFHLLLPTDLLRKIGQGGDADGATSIDNRLGELPGTLTDQLGLGVHPVVGIVILAVAVAGAVIAVRRRPALDLMILLLAVFTTYAIADRGRKVDRYWLQVTVWIAYFAVVAVIAAGELAVRRRRRALALATAALLILVGVHLVTLRGDIEDARDFNSAGLVQFGPAHPEVAPVFDAVVELTPPDAVVAYFRARTMTLLTDRRSFQSTSADEIAANADYFVQRRNSRYWQPDLSDDDAEALGFESIWSNSTFEIWATGR